MKVNIGTKIKKLICVGDAVRVSASYQWATVQCQFPARLGVDMLTIAGQGQDNEGEKPLGDSERE